jgi:hypothetical protein
MYLEMERLLWVSDRQQPALANEHTRSSWTYCRGPPQVSSYTEPTPFILPT